VSTHTPEQDRTPQLPSEVEIELEDRGNATALRSAFTTLTGQSGTQEYRFVARPRGEEASAPVLASDSFPVLPLQLPLDSLTEKDAFADEILGSLRDLQAALERDGWRAAGRGTHWWSHVYVR
jgi:hypothetical protein